MMNKKDLSDKIYCSLLLHNKWSVNEHNHVVHMDGIQLEREVIHYVFRSVEQVVVKKGKKYMILEGKEALHVLDAMNVVIDKIRMKEAEEFSNELEAILK